jgi:hypothetical protein
MDVSLISAACGSIFPTVFGVAGCSETAAQEEEEARAMELAVKESISTDGSQTPTLESEEEEARAMELAVKESISSGTQMPTPSASSSGGGVAAAALDTLPPPSADSPGRWLDRMAGLLSMGFTDVAANTAALQHHNGDIALAVNELLSLQ